MPSMYDILGGLLGVVNPQQAANPLNQSTQMQNPLSNFTGGIQQGLNKLFNFQNQPNGSLNSNVAGMPSYYQKLSPAERAQIPSVSPESLGAKSNPLDKDQMNKLMMMQYMMGNSQSQNQMPAPSGSPQMAMPMPQGGAMGQMQYQPISSFPSPLQPRPNFIGRSGY
jgi:hypothetical protein